MSEFTAWMQSNWYALGNLLLEIAFLTAGIWFARKILRTMRASQEQVGALLKLSVTGAVTERQPLAAVADRPVSSPSPYWLTPAEVPPADQPKAAKSGPSRLVAAGHGLVAWLNTPMSSGSGEGGTWRKAIKWLQSPAGS
jgi:hypothetical protein